MIDSRSETPLELKRRQLEQRRRAAEEIEATIRDYAVLTLALHEQISAEEFRTHQWDPAHFQYSPAAKAARSRRQKLLETVKALSLKCEQIKGEIHD
jgi:flagellar protein FliJ